MKKLHIDNIHRSLSAEFTEFVGWEMPLKYSSVAEEHMAVREAAGLFDVSHMGEFLVSGPSALSFLQRVTTNNVSKLPDGGAQYSTVTNERGGTKDDITVYRIGEGNFMVVCNASNVEKIGGWFNEHRTSGVEIKDVTMTTTLFSLQGPKSQSVLQRLTGFDLTQIGRFKFAQINIAGVETLASRTGYTGENGFELYILNEPMSNPSRASKLWRAILGAGESDGVKPCGLGARDTTRLEAGMCLYGNELTEEITPLEARIDFVVKFEKGDFIGREALLMQKSSGLKRVRVGLRMLEPGIPRHGYGIFHDGEKVGWVTSGTFSPLLRVGIAIGYVSPEIGVGEKVEVDIHDRQRAAQVVSFPFYDPAKYGHTRK
jgi:aminomethyltransferase